MSPEARAANPPRAMLVDLDDTIIDYRTGVDPCWRLVCADATARVPGLDAGALFQEVLRTREWYWSDPERHRIGRADLVAASAGVVLRSLRKRGFDLPDLARDLGRSYREKRDEVAVLVPGAVEALRRFRSRGIALAMITNGASATQRAKIERFHLAPYFDHILVEGELGFGKPEPEVYLKAMAALRSSPADTWCVGDNLEWEVAAPQRLGIYSVWVDPTGAGPPPGSPVRPDRTVASIAELAF